MESDNMSGSHYAIRRKKLLSLITELRQFGAQADLDLPGIAIVGNQSAGKSSVVEAISGIKVPRDSGTCTRCPIECRMSSSTGSWTCQVSIRWEFDEHGHRLSKIDEVPFGKRITKPEDVELALRRAQTAVLNPHSPAMYFVALGERELSDVAVNNPASLRFSRNVVCVDLEGPDLVDLSYMDLPGIIQNADPITVGLVENLVVSHIKGNCLILVALPMTDDIENQKALRLAHQEDPDGHRTIGVMTKPDLLSAGSTKSRELWLDVLEGRRYPLTHGYYCTRQPDDADRIQGITSANSRIAEVEYFAKTLPWSTTKEQDRLGTHNLVSALSKLLVGLIDDSLPKLLFETISQLEVCDRRLSTLPPVVEADPMSHMSNLITSFVFEVKRHVQGGHGVERLNHDNRTAFSLFKRAIRRTAPNFIPALDGVARDSHQHVVDSFEDEIAADIDLDSKPVYLSDMRAYIQKSITRELPGKVPFEVNVSLIKAFQSTWELSTNSCLDQVQLSLLKTLHDCVRDTFHPYETLQNHLKGLISEIVKRHRDLCFHHLSAVLETQQTPFTQNTHYLQTCQDKWLTKYRDARTKAAAVPVRSPSADFGTTSLVFTPPSKQTGKPTQKMPNSSSKNRVDKLPTSLPASSDIGGAAFSSQPQSLTFDEYTNCEAFKWTEGRGSFSRPIAETSLFSKSDDNALLAMLAERGFSGLTIADLGKLNPPDEFDTELRVMAEVRGYFQVAYKKIIDIIPELMDLTFIKAVAKELQPYLYKKLDFGATDASTRFSKFLAEDSKITARRESLLSQKMRLERIKQGLYNFGL